MTPADTLATQGFQAIPTAISFPTWRKTLNGYDRYISKLDSNEDGDTWLVGVYNDRGDADILEPHVSFLEALYVATKWRV